jgi:hypothetical protein
VPTDNHRDAALAPSHGEPEPVIHFPSLTLPEPETTPIMVKKGFGATFYETRKTADKAS